MKIIILDKSSVSQGDVDFSMFEKLGETVVFEKTEEADIVKNIGEAEIVLSNKIPLKKEVLSACPNLKYIGLFATGYNAVDVKYARERGILVANVPSYSTNAVAAYTFSHILNAATKVSEYSSLVKQGKWGENQSFFLKSINTLELFEMTLGIVGYGEIGKAVAKIASAFGMNVCFCSKSKKGSDKYAKEVDFDKLLSCSDIISLHCPLNEDTKNIIDKNSLDRMKAGVMLVNTARGGLIDEGALVKAVDDGKISYALLDVTKNEPIGIDNALLKSERIIVTPHMAWAAQKTRERVVFGAYSNLEAFLLGNPTNIVN